MLKRSSHPSKSPVSRSCSIGAANQQVVCVLLFLVTETASRGTDRNTSSGKVSGNQDSSQTCSPGKTEDFLGDRFDPLYLRSAIAGETMIETLPHNSHTEITFGIGQELKLVPVGSNMDRPKQLCKLIQFVQFNLRSGRVSPGSADFEF